MLSTICSNTIDKDEFQQCCSMLETQLIKPENKLSQLDDNSVEKNQRQKQLFLLYEYANRQAIIAKNQGRLEIWQSWEKIIDYLSEDCDRIEAESKDDYYLIY